jgi:hypothetical protein
VIDQTKVPQGRKLDGWLQCLLPDAGGPWPVPWRLPCSAKELAHGPIKARDDCRSQYGGTCQSRASTSPSKIDPATNPQPRNLMVPILSQYPNQKSEPSYTHNYYPQRFQAPGELARRLPQIPRLT